MKVGEARTQLAVRLEATARCVHLYPRRGEWVVLCELEDAVVLSSGVRRVGRTSKDEMAFEEIALVRPGEDEWRWSLGE